MSELIVMKKKDNNLCDAPSVVQNNKIEIDDNICYNCTECSSLIEILSINEDNNIIKFRCLKEDFNKTKVMTITEYLNKKNNYAKKEINQDLCEIHNKNKYVSYCFDCNCHICNECLKSRIHFNHNKNNIVEIQPTQRELHIIKEVIEDYKIKINDLNKEKDIKEKELEKKINENKIYEKTKIEEIIEINKKNEEEELKINKNTYLVEIEEIKKKYLCEFKKRKNKFITDIKNIRKKYKLINEKDYILNKNKIEQLNNKLTEDFKKLKYDNQIENLTNIKKINELIYNSYISYNNNYYNCININNIIYNYY